MRNKFGGHVGSEKRRSRELPLRAEIFISVAFQREEKIRMAVESTKIGQGEEIIRSSPCIMVVFGASGDLTKRKLSPACITWRRKVVARRIRHSGIWAQNV